MFKRYFSLALAVLLFPLLAVPSVAAQDCQPTDTKLLTGSDQGYYYKLGTAIAQVARGERLNLCVQTTDHNLDNASELRDGKAEFGIAQSDIAHDAWFGHPKRFPERVADVKIVMPLYVEAVHILLRPHLNISKLADLRGKKVGVGLANSGTEYTAQHILAAVGLQAEGSGANFEAVRTSDPVFCHSVQMLMNGTLDALIKVTVVPSVDLQDALRTDPDATGKQEESHCANAWEIKLLALDHDLTERLVQDGSYSETLIPRSAYNQSESTLTVGVQALLLAGKNASGNDVEKLARLVRFKHHAIDNALEDIVKGKHKGHNHRAGNLPQLSLLDVPISSLAEFVHPRAQPYVYDWWRDSWVPELPGILSTAAVIFALLFWKRTALGHAMERQPNLIFAVAGTLLIWLIAACTFYHYEWAVNEHFNSFLRSLVSTFLYLTSLSEYSLLTQDAQSFAQKAKWINVVVLGGFASPLLKQGLDALLKKIAKRLQWEKSRERRPSPRAVQNVSTEASSEDASPMGDQEFPDFVGAAGAD